MLFMAKTFPNESFEPIARYTISTRGSDDVELFATELALIHRTILKLLRVPASDYRP